MARLLSCISKLAHTNKLKYLIQRVISGSVQQPRLDKELTLSFPSSTAQVSATTPLCGIRH